MIQALSNYFYNVKLFDRDDYYDYTERPGEQYHSCLQAGTDIIFSAKELVMNHKDYPADMSCHIKGPQGL